VLRESKEPLKENREKIDGTPLRQSWELPSLTRSLSALRYSDNPAKRYFLYEAQTSVAVTGIDDFVWTAYGFVDTYFGSDESVDRYQRWTSRKARPDPLAAGQIEATLPIPTPREYFLKVLEIRIHQVRREMRHIVEIVENEIKQYV
jgi:hypothetical protein